MQKLKQKVRDLIGSRHIVRGMFIASVLESTIVPIPLEAALLPLMQARRDKIWALASAATLGCIVGAMFGYALGYFIFELIEPWLIGNLATQAQLDEAVAQMQEQGFYFILTLGIVPIPLQIAMVVAGATSYSIFLYVIAIAISRVIRYFGIAIVVYYAGNHAERILLEHKFKVTVLLLLMIATAWWFGLRP
jgi:membrane protein YqaA with SNARE-associated domain